MDNKLPLLIGIAIAGLGAMLLLPKKVMAEVTPGRTIEVTKPLPLVQVRFSGFSYLMDTFIKDMTDRRLITNVVCKDKATYTRECTVNAYLQTIEDLKKYASTYGVSIFV